MSRLQPEDRRTEGEARRVAVPLAMLQDASGTRQRELLLGAGFRVLEEASGRARGFAEADGYSGWIAAEALGPPRAPTHRLTAIRSYAKRTPELKRTEPLVWLSRGCLLTVEETVGDWAAIDLPEGRVHLPAAHLGPAATPDTDPIAVAELYLGTPYLWGGNSALGIDCSGLVQAALAACHRPCPGDSDQQETAFSRIERAQLRRGDLVFWKGHVGLMLDPETLLHANAHHMAVAAEPLSQAIARIHRSGGGAVTSFRRP